MNGVELLNSIATVGGVINSDAVKTLLANPELAKIEIPKEIAEAYQTKFLTMETAKANAEIAKHFQKLIYSEALTPVDQKLETAMQKFGFSDEQKDAVRKSEGTFKRLDKFNEFADTITSSFTSVTDKKKFQGEIEKLNTELAGKDSAFQAQLKKVNDEYDNELSALTFRHSLLERPLVTTETQTIEDTLLLADSKIRRALKEKGADAKFDKTTKTFKLVQLANPELAYTEGHKEIQFNDFRDKVLADSKLIKVTSSAPPQRSNTHTPAGNEPTASLKDVKFNQSTENDLENFTSAPAGA